MNYYERHLGDYAKDTAHLTMLEHGAYGLLLDRYYSTEQGIPVDQVHRIARARTRDEKAAVDAVLAEFFKLADGIWINKRTEEEIAKAMVKIDAARGNGKKGGRPKKVELGSENETQQKPGGLFAGSENETQQKPGGLFAGSENETQQKAHQTPDTKHQTPDTSKHTHSSGQSENAGDGNFPQRVSIAGAVCTVLKAEGIAAVNPGNVDLLSLLEAGAEVGNFQAAARIAVAKGKGFAYALGIVKSQLAEAQRMGTEASQATHQPASETTYQRSMRERYEEASGKRRQAVIDITPTTLEMSQ